MPAYKELTPLYIEQGATYKKTYQYVSALTPLTPVNITGWTTRMMFRAKMKDIAPVLSLTQTLKDDLNWSDFMLRANIASPCRPNSGGLAANSAALCANDLRGGKLRPLLIFYMHSSLT